MASWIEYENHYFYYHFISFSIIIFHFHTLFAEPISSFSLQNLNSNKVPNFDSSFSLLGDAQISIDGNFVSLTSPSLSGSSSGQIIYKKPFKFLDTRSLKPTISFSTEFTFSITPGNGDGVAFVIFQSFSDFSKVFDQGYFGISDNFDGNFVAVEFDTRKDDQLGDVNGNNHVSVNVGKFVSIGTSDVSSIGLILNCGKPLRSWIDYESSSKRLEVRLGESGSERPYKALVSSEVDLSKMWGDKDVLVGISSSNSNSMQMILLHSWSFSARSVNEKHQIDVGEKSYFLGVLGNLIFGTGCGTLVAFVALFFWVILYGRHSNVAPELPMSANVIKYEKVNVTVDNDSDDVLS